MHDVPAAAPSSLLRRLADRWRLARSAALLHQLQEDVDAGAQELSPAPRSLAHWVHPTLRGLAHPAVWEVGVPAVVLFIVGSAIRSGWAGVLPALPEQRILWLLFQPVWAFATTSMGKAIFDRRYSRLAMEVYQRERWRVAAARHASDDGAPMPNLPASGTTTASRPDA